MKIISFNIRFGSAKDGANSWEFRKNILFNVIKKHDPDIIGMQEVEYFQLTEILNVLKEYATIGQGRNGENQGEMNPVLFKKEKLFCTETCTLWLSNSPDKPSSTSYGNRLPRIFTWGTFETLDEKKEAFLFVNTHLDHETSVARIEGAKQILTFISEQNKYHKVIVTGDFNNQSLDAEEVQLFFKSGFKSSTTYMQSDELGFTFHGFSGLNRFTWGLSTIIDYIFVRGFNITASSIIKDNENGKYPSDHFPVITILS